VPADKAALNLTLIFNAMIRLWLMRRFFTDIFPRRLGSLI
jgi:hypothetical protein